MHPFDYYQQLKLLEDERNRERNNYHSFALLGFNCSLDNHRTKGLAHLINGKWQKAINFNEVNACRKCNGYNKRMYDHHMSLFNYYNDLYISIKNMSLNG